MKEISAGKSQKRRRMVLRRTARCSREFAATSATEIPSEKKNNGLYLFRDSSSIEPPATAYEPDRGDNKLNFNIYAEVANPKFIVCPEDIWMPKMEDTAGISLLLTHFKPLIELHVERLKRSTARVLDHGAIEIPGIVVKIHHAAHHGATHVAGRKAARIVFLERPYD